MKDTNFLPKPSEDTAEFNNAFAFLERLNKTEYLIEEALMKWELKHAFSALESYENELSFSFKGEDQSNVDEIKQRCIKILNEIPNIGSTGKDAGGKSYVIGQGMNGELRGNLITLNKKLRGIKNKRGMGMPTKGEGKLF